MGASDPACQTADWTQDGFRKGGGGWQLGVPQGNLNNLFRDVVEGGGWGYGARTGRRLRGGFSKI